jgi:5-oxoprolinase (ATP-hydrolysing)
MRANILADRRSVAPRGICGGGDAAPGENRVERADGTVEQLGYKGSAVMHSGDSFVILTPGGGGYGSSD